MKKLLLVLIIFVNIEVASACSITSGGICAGAECPSGKECNKISDTECKCQKIKKELIESSISEYTWVLKKVDVKEIGAAAIAQGCCGKKSSGVCSAPVLKRDCPSGYSWKKNKSCYEKDKTGCMD